MYRLIIILKDFNLFLQKKFIKSMYIRIYVYGNIENQFL